MLVGAAMGPAVLTAYLLADTLASSAAAKTHTAILTGVACNAGAGIGAALAGTAVTTFDTGRAFALTGIIAAALTIVGCLVFMHDRKRINPHGNSADD
ncbi:MULTISPECIES: hypothetical protein [Actinomadura]|uniref:MFS transporter n=1 Tax=Actinomadura yumaensis TaxID=111807 RepID=A0ABW2CUE3_9ACTN|nr:hypothetical protein [Actinomadura sp. J1-007]MWK34097.1 hypothetical protein [Actinomadura sp. J1-007]